MLITNNKNLDQLTPGSSGWVRRSEDRQINQIKWWIQQIFGPFSVTTADLNETWRDTALVTPHLVFTARIINKATIFVSMESPFVFLQIFWLRKESCYYVINWSVNSCDDKILILVKQVMLTFQWIISKIFWLRIESCYYVINTGLMDWWGLHI